MHARLMHWLSLLGCPVVRRVCLREEIREEMHGASVRRRHTMPDA